MNRPGKCRDSFLKAAREGISEPRLPAVPTWILISGACLTLFGCSGHQPPSAPGLAESAKLRNAPIVAAPTAKVVKAAPATQHSRNGTAIESAAKQFIQPSLDEQSAYDEATAHYPSTVGAQHTRMIWQRLQSGFSLDFDDTQAVRQELNALGTRTIERRLAQSSEYLYLVLDAVERRGLPSEIALLPLVESGYNPSAVSPGKAAGLWQFLPGTARNFGLTLSHGYDGRHDIVASTHAALDYLEYLGDLFGGDWLLALTAYNTGEGNVQRWMRKNRTEGKPIEWSALPVPDQVRRYIPRLIAMREVIENAKRYGVELPDIPDRPVLDSIDVKGRLDLAAAAAVIDLTPSQILRYNPGIQSRTIAALPGPLLLPAVHAKRLKDYLDNGNATPAASIAEDVASPHLAIDPSPSLRQEAARALNEPRIVHTRASPKTHTVRSGESLYVIAKTHRVDTADLAKWNKLSSTAVLQIGQQLMVEDPRARPSTKQDIAAQKTLSYSVRAGDSLSSIASRFGVRVDDLALWNGIKTTHILQTGQRLIVRIPARTSQESAAVSG